MSFYLEFVIHVRKKHIHYRSDGKPAIGSDGHLFLCRIMTCERALRPFDKLWARRPFFLWEVYQTSKVW